MKGIPKSLIISSVFLVLIFIIGIFGYKIIEGWGFFDAFYMTVITLATIGYGEVHPLSPSGRVFTIVLIFLGIGTLTYVVSAWLSFFIEGHLGGMLKKRKMNKLIQHLKQHYILCVSDEMGMYVIEEFFKTKRNFVIISNDNQVVLPYIKNMKNNEDVLYIEGNPEEDVILQQANIENAKGLVAVLGDDRENLYVTLTARQLNPNIRIVSQAIDRKSVPKLTKAGADEVVSAIEIGGMRIASTMIRPAVVNFLDAMLYGKDKPLRFEEHTIPEGSSFIGKSLGDSSIPQRTGLLVVAIKEKSAEKYVFNPGANYVLQKDDILVVVGDTDQNAKLAELIK